MFHCVLRCGMTSLALGFAFSGSAFAAPPKLDYLYPAGAQRGTTVTVTVGGTFERWPVKAWCDARGVDVTPAKQSGQLAVTVGKDVEPGVYAIRLYDHEGASVARPFIVGQLPEVTEKEPNDDPKKPQVIEQASVVVNGRLDKLGDVDTFTVKLTKGQTLVASLEANRTLRSPMDGVLQLLSPDGFVLDRNDDYHSLDPQIAYPIVKDGTYLVRVFAFPSVADSSIRFAGKETFVYRLTLTSGPFVEYTYPLAVSRSAPGEVDLIGWNIPEELRKFTIPPKKGQSALTLFHPAIANPFTVRLEANAGVAKTVATRDEPMTVAPPITITGRLDKPGDIDVYRFDAKKGDKLAIRIDALSLGMPLDPVLRLTTPIGKTITQVRGAKIGSDPVLDLVVKEDATYGLEVSDLQAGGSLRHVYQLRIGPLVADFDVKTTVDNFTLSAGKPLEIPVTVTRVGGYKSDVTLNVEGLPGGVDWTATAKSITLRLTAEKVDFAGPIRNVGSATDGTTRSAMAPVVELGRPTPNLWLTVTAKK